MTAAEFAARLEGVRRSGAEWLGKCPAHDDRTPSLSVSDGEDGRVLYHCHGGCPPDAVLAAMHLTWGDIMPDRMNGRAAPVPAPARTRDADAVLAAWTPPDAPQGQTPSPPPIARQRGARRDHEGPVIPDAVPAAYHVALIGNAGLLEWLHVRRGLTRETVEAYEIGHDGQRFTFPVRDEAGACRNLRKYKLDGNGADKMLSYRAGYGRARLFPLHMFNPGDDRVVIVEGEGDCLLARQFGFNAITATGGAGTWRDEWAPLFAGADVVIAYDNDEAGGDGAERVARSLYGIAASAHIHRWDDDSPAGYDVTNYLHGDGHTADELRARLDAAPLYVPPVGATTSAGEADGPSAVDTGPDALLFTDVANAARFSAAYGADVKFSPTLGWLVWDGQRYANDEAAAKQRAKRLSRDVILPEALAEADDDKRGKLMKLAIASASAGRVRATLELAQSEPGIRVSSDELDRHAWLLNVANGTVDLRTGTLRPHDRADLLTKVAGTAIAERADCPRMLAFLDRIFAGNAALIAFMKRAIGYILTGSTREQVLFFLYGLGANGKSTLLELLLFLLGDYGMAASFSLLSPQREGPRNDVARLRGARGVTAVESAENARLDETVVKQLTGGDTITARFLHKEFFSFSPQLKVLLAANHKPVIGGTDHAIWRRIVLVPFVVTIPEAERDSELLNRLKDEAPAILRWAVDGCLEWQRDGLRPPPEVTAATREYRSEMDVLAGFFDECTERDESARTPAGTLYAVYRAWARHAGESELTATKFGTRLTESGFASVKSGIWFRRGLRLSPLGEQLQGTPDARRERPSW